MKRHLLVLATAFGVSAALGTFAGCFVSGDCECPPTPARPEPQGPLPGLSVTSYDARGERAMIGVAPEDGTMQVTSEAVVIRYRQEGVAHQVEYAVVGAR